MTTYSEDLLAMISPTEQKMVEEIPRQWKSLSDIGYSNYSISDDGLIKDSLTGEHVNVIDKHRYYKVSLTDPVTGSKSNHPLHRLLAIAWIPNPMGLPLVDHIDRDKFNNHLSNLRWVTRRLNSLNCDKINMTPSSQFQGVSLVKTKQKRGYVWRANLAGVYINGVSGRKHTKFLGNYLTEEEAFNAYKVGYHKYRGYPYQE